jgi:acyl-CoA synthetase (AMP-forming)/AMP-acid ligase II
MSQADTFARILDAVVRHAARQPCLVTLRQRMNFDELTVRLEELARRLRHIPHRSLVALCCRRPGNFVVGYFGCLLAGLVPVPLSPLLKERDFGIQTQGCAFVLSDAETNAMVQVTKLEGSPFVLEEERIAVLLTTSGTVNRPRRVALSLENIMTNAHSVAMHLRSGASDAALVALPLCHSFAHTTQMWAQLLMEAPLVLTDGPFIPRQFMDLIDEFNVATTGVVAQSLRVLRTVLGYPPQRTANAQMKIVVTGSVIELGLFEYAYRCFPNARVIQGYGLTEASPRVTMEPLDVSPRVVRGIRSSGQPLPGMEVRILCPKQCEVAPLEDGEIHVRGPGVMLGYLGVQGLTRSTDSSGWLPTGDIGFRDDEGWLFVLGRHKNAFLNRGFRIYPEEIESFVLEDPRVLRCRALDQEGRYVVEIESHQINDTNEVLERFRRELPYWKIPDLILLSEIPTSISEKVRRGGDTDS